MKNPKDRETTNREDMMCTLCDTEGLEANPAYEDEYDGRAELLKATRCPNEDCDYHKGMPRDQIEMQMPNNSLLNIGAILGSDLTAKDILTYVVVIGGAIFMAFSLGLIPTGNDTTNPEEPTEVQSNISGTVFSVGSGDYTVSLYQNKTRVETTALSSDGTYRFASVPNGNYTVYLENGNGNSPPGKSISISDQSEQGTVNFQTSSENQDAVNLNQTVGQGFLNLNFSNPDNVEDVNLQLSPIIGDNIQRSVRLDEDREMNVVMPSFPREQQITVQANETLQTSVDNRRYEGRPQTYQILGNAEAKNMQITLSNQSSADVSTRQVRVTGGRATETVTVASNETLGPVRVTIGDGTSQDKKQEIGTWSGGRDNITLVTGTSSFTSGVLQVSPSPIRTNRSVNGTISDGEITESIQGNVPAKNVTVAFEGGDASAALVGSQETNVNAENGSTGEIVREAVTIQESGSYRLEWNINNSRDSNFTSYAYRINSNTTEITDQNGGTAVSLDKNDTVSLVAEATRKALDDTDEPPVKANEMRGDVDIDVSFTPSNPQSGDVIKPTITIENEGSSDIEQNVALFQNGKEFSSTRVSIPVGQTINLDESDFGQPAVNQEGLHVFYLNDVGPFFLNVGNVEERYGVGFARLEVLDVGARGQINMDTNDDGEYDCSVVADGGVCDIGTLPTGVNTLSVEEKGVSNTQYKLEYTSIENPRDVMIDVGEDGLIDFENDGLLNSTQSTAVELPPNSTNVSISSSNNIPVEYAFSWDADSVVNNPVVDIEGDVVIQDEGSFVEDRTYEVGQLSEGTYTFRFRAESGGYNARIEWNEQRGQSFPEAVIDDEVVCQPQDFVGEQTCTVTEEGLSVGQHTIEFRQPPSESFNYQLQKQERAFADEVSVFVDGQREVRFFRPSVQPEPWEDVESTTAFEIGDNNVNVTVEEQNGIQPNLTTRLDYVLDGDAPQNLTVTVTNDVGQTTEIDIPQSSLSQDVLASGATISIPEEALSVGSNRISFESEGGIFELQGSITLGESESVNLQTTR